MTTDISVGSSFIFVLPVKVIKSSVKHATDHSVSIGTTKDYGIKEISLLKNGKVHILSP